MSSKNDPDSSSIAIFVNMHAKRTPLLLIVLLHIPYHSCFPYVNIGKCNLCLSLSSLCQHKRTKKSSIPITIMLDGEITFQVWQFVVHLPRFCLQN